MSFHFRRSNEPPPPISSLMTMEAPALFQSLASHLSSQPASSIQLAMQSMFSDLIQLETDLGSSLTQLLFPLISWPLRSYSVITVCFLFRMRWRVQDSFRFLLMFNGASSIFFMCSTAYKQHSLNLPAILSSSTAIAIHSIQSQLLNVMWCAWLALKSSISTVKFASISLWSLGLASPAPMIAALASISMAVYSRKFVFLFPLLPSILLLLGSSAPLELILQAMRFSILYLCNSIHMLIYAGIIIYVARFIRITRYFNRTQRRLSIRAERPWLTDFVHCWLALCVIHVLIPVLTNDSGFFLRRMFLIYD